MAFRIAAALAIVGSMASLGQAGNRYFYHQGRNAYYCERPETYTNGCYVVCDEPNVVKINGFPVISTANANQLCQGAAQRGPMVGTPPSPGVVHPTPPSDDCCPPTIGGNCLPRIIDPCHCVGDKNVTKICFEPGTLQTVCKTTRFYKAIGTIEGTIPVPQICVTAKEVYKFRPRTLEFDCKDAQCDDVDCKDLDCKDHLCKVQSCEVYERVENCDATCKMCPRKGTLVIAIRANGHTADVFIGKAGKASFPEYPRNLVVVQNRSQAEIRRLLQNNAIDFGTIISGSATDNLLEFLCDDPTNPATCNECVTGTVDAAPGGPAGELVVAPQADQPAQFPNSAQEADTEATPAKASVSSSGDPGLLQLLAKLDPRLRAFRQLMTSVEQ